MSSDEVDKKSDEETKETGSSAEEDEKKDDGKTEKVNSKPAPKKKAAADPPKIKQPAKKRVKEAEKETTNKKEEKKKAQKEVEEEESEEDDEDTENHKDVPLLDQPLEITGNRKRKEVQRFVPIANIEQEKKEVKIPEGKGKALGDMEIVEAGLQRAKPEDLKLLHRLCFNKIGQKSTMRKFLRKFNGWGFEEGSDDFEKKKAQIRISFKKVTVAHLKNLCIILDIEQKGAKDDILDRILSYLVCPVDSGRKLPQGRSKRKGAAEKNYDEGDDDDKLNKKGRKKASPKKKTEVSEESENDEPEKEEKKIKQNNKNKENSTEDSEPEEEEEEEGEDEEEEEEVKKPKKAPAKKGKKAAAVAEKKAPPKKRAAAKKAAEKTDSEGAAEGDDESESEEPNVKKAKTPPTDEEIKTYVKSLLDGANLELITMKKVCQDVYAHYPEFDLSSRKDFIKTTVKNLISS